MNPRYVVPGSLITHEMLLGLDACYRQRVKFRKEWPDGMPLRRKNLLRAAEIGLDVHWAASAFSFPVYRSPSLTRQRDTIGWGKDLPGIRKREAAYMVAVALYIWGKIRDR